MKAWAKILNSEDRINGAKIGEAMLENFAKQDGFIPIVEDDGSLSIAKEVEVGNVTDPGDILTRSSKPVGPGARHWCIDHCGTSGPVTCEWCGTTWNDDPEYEENGGGEDVSLSSFGGFTIVDECCGAVLDRLFLRLGEPFFEAHLRVFCEDPLSEENHFTRKRIIQAVKDMRERLDSITEYVAEGGDLDEIEEY
jgi:hypothetical protein